MSLLDRLREAQDEPARHRASPYAGPSILSVEQLRAMERALAREGFFDRDIRVSDVVEAPQVIDEPALAPEPLPVWTPPVFEPLPVWTPPVSLDPCPNCGEEIAIDRIDLTVDAGWITCRACGLRRGGAIDQGWADRTPFVPALPPADGKSGERGQIAAG